MHLPSRRILILESRSVTDTEDGGHKASTRENQQPALVTLWTARPSRASVRPHHLQHIGTITLELALPDAADLR
jgi:hypothetical protein